MKLTEARKLFDELRKQGKIQVKYHAIHEHPERGFTRAEIFYLVSETTGRLSHNNKFPTSVEGSFFYECKDRAHRNVEIALVLEDNIVVIHAFRRV